MFVHLCNNTFQQSVFYILDLIRLYQRHNVAANPWKSLPDVSSMNAMRLIAASPGEESQLRKNLTHRLYYELWVKQQGENQVFLLP